MIDRAHDLPITKQAEALNISRGSVYYLPRPVSEADLAIMRRLDRLHLEFPFAGSRMLRGLLMAEEQDRPHVGAHVAVGGEERRPKEKRRNEDEKHELGIEVHRGQPGEERCDEAAHEEHRRRRDGEPAGEHGEEAHAHEQGQHRLEILHAL